MDELTGLFKEIEERRYDSTACFLCGKILNKSNRTDEHVFPRWLQKELKLQNLILQLPNETTVAYKRLKIPCCKECNNKYLSTLENDIYKAFKDGYEAFCKLDYTKIYLWISKIFFGQAYKDMFLLLDRKKPSKGTILDEEFLKSLRTIYLLLQEVRNKHVCRNFTPASIFILKMQNDNTEMMRWDFVDRIFKNFVALRMNDIGIIVVLNDCGIVKDYFDYNGLINDFYKVDLHPIQFNELCAIVFHQSILFNRNPCYTSIQKDGNDVVETYLIPLQGFSNKPLFDEWNPITYNEILSSFTGYPYEELLTYGEQTITWIRDQLGEINFMPIEEYRFTDLQNIDISLIRPEI